MKIAILGAGVAGVSTAISLKQKGFDVCLYERHGCASNIGAGIVAWPNATFVLDQLGVLSEIRAVSGRPAKMQRLSNRGEALGAIDIVQINQRMGYPSLSILRRDLQRILINKLESLGVHIQYSHAVVDIKTTDSDQAEVHFQNGLKVSADIIVGADGRMASAARQYVCEDNEPVYQGFINWVGVFETEADIFRDLSISDYWGTGERFGIVPIESGRAYWAGGIACREVGQKNPSEYKIELNTVFSDWPAPVRQMINETPNNQINKIFVHDHNPTQTWHKNNLIVIGDAAHAPLPTSGQGACQALEDTWHLANCLHQSPHHPHKAFVDFTTIRFAKTTSITMAARGFASTLFNPDEEFCRSRNENSKVTDFKNAARGMATLWGQHLPLGCDFTTDRAGSYQPGLYFSGGAI